VTPQPGNGATNRSFLVDLTLDAIMVERGIQFSQNDYCASAKRSHVGALQIMRLPRSQEEGQRIPKGVDHGMDFGA
jgi:hypothetical protein